MSILNGKIKSISDSENKETILPLTVTKAVYHKDGRDLENIINSLPIGENINIDSMFNEYLSPNRFAGVYPDGVSIEYSRDGGQTWKDYGVSDIDKRRLFTTRSCAFRIGGPSEVGDYTSNGRLRITLKTGAANIYTVLERIHIYASTAFSEDCKITIKAALESDHDNYVKTIVEDMPFEDWPGWAMINLADKCGAITTYGNESNIQYGRIRFEFSAGELTDPTQTEYGFQVTSIFGYGGVGWETPSNMALNGHAYAYDADMAVEFPSTVSADNGFIGSGRYLDDLNVDNVSYGVLPIEYGGTGATTLEGARETLGINNDEINYLINGGQKNVFEFVNDNDVLITNGITFTKLSNGEIIANGTATTSAFYKSNDFTLPEGDYILNGGAKDGASDKWALQYYVNGSVADNIYDDETSINFTANASKTFSVYIVIRSGQTVSNLTFKPMIRPAIISDSTFTPYAPTNKKLYDSKASQDEMNFIINGNQKNQFGTAIANSITWNSSVTYDKVSECEYTLTATATSSSDLALFNTDNAAYKNLYGLENTNYIITANNANILFTIDMSTNGTSWGTSTYPNWQPSPISFDLSKAKGVRIRCRLKKGTSLNNTNIKFMLCPSYIKDSTFIPYAPTNRELYENKLNTSDMKNTYGIEETTVPTMQSKVEENSKNLGYKRVNLFDDKNPTYPDTMLSANSTLDDTEYYDTWKINVIGLKNITVSLTKKVNYQSARYATGNGSTINGREFNDNDEFVVDVSNNEWFYITFLKNTTLNVQIEEGTVPTPYEPYKLSVDERLKAKLNIGDVPSTMAEYGIRKTTISTIQATTATIDVPEKAMTVGVSKLYGKTIKVGNELYSATVERFVSRGKDNTVKNTVSVPQEIKNLPDYGCGIDDEHNNIVNIDAGLYEHSCVKDNLGNHNYNMPVTNLFYTGEITRCERAICSKYTYVNVNATDNTTANSLLKDKEFTYRHGTNDRIYFKDSAISTADAFKTTNANVEIVYSQPTTTQSISSYIRPLPVETGGTVTFENQHNVNMNSEVKFKKEV